MSKSVLPDLLRLVEPYLDRQAAAWAAQPPRDRRPTLPSTTDGKVNVRAITTALGLERSQEQHFFKQPDLRSVVNAVAQEQGLKPIGARSLSEEMGKAVAARIRRTDKRSGELAALVAEQAATIERQRRTIDGLRERLRIFEETGQHLRIAGGAV
jgi:uncharacterized coiled-coil protein SlyX